MKYEKHALRPTIKGEEKEGKNIGEKAYIFTIGCSFEDNASQ